MSAKPRVRISSDRSRIIADGDLEIARATVAGATLCDGLQESLAVELEVDCLQCVGIVDLSPAGMRRTVLAYYLELEKPFPIIARLALECFAGQELVRLETFRRLSDRWAPTGTVALGLGASRAIAKAILQRAPEPAEEGGAP